MTKEEIKARVEFDKKFQKEFRRLAEKIVDIYPNAIRAYSFEVDYYKDFQPVIFYEYYDEYGDFHCNGTIPIELLTYSDEELDEYIKKVKFSKEEEERKREEEKRIEEEKRKERLEKSEVESYLKLKMKYEDSEYGKMLFEKYFGNKK